MAEPRETPRHLSGEASSMGRWGSRSNDASISKDDSVAQGDALQSTGRHMGPAHVTPYTRPESTQPWQKSTGDWPADLVDEDERHRSVVKEIVEWAAIVGCAIGAAFLIRAFVVEPFEIPSESMLETIQVGDRVLGEKITYLLADPKAGDIVTFEDPEDPATTLIKRVIATPGQTVDLVDGAVAVDGEVLDEPYTQGQSLPLPGQSSVLSEPITYPYTLGEDEYWVMGDNRENSLDSRYFGPITRDEVTSKAWIVFWPFSEIRPLS